MLCGRVLLFFSICVCQLQLVPLRLSVSRSVFNLAARLHSSTYCLCLQLCCLFTFAFYSVRGISLFDSVLNFSLPLPLVLPLRSHALSGQIDCELHLLAMPVEWLALHNQFQIATHKCALDSTNFSNVGRLFVPLPTSQPNER